jgi:hypothetical protein
MTKAFDSLYLCLSLSLSRLCLFELSIFLTEKPGKTKATETLLVSTKLKQTKLWKVNFWKNELNMKSCCFQTFGVMRN